MTTPCMPFTRPHLGSTSHSPTPPSTPHSSPQWSRLAAQLLVTPHPSPFTTQPPISPPILLLFRLNTCLRATRHPLGTPPGSLHRPAGTLQMHARALHLRPASCQSQPPVVDQSFAQLNRASPLNASCGAMAILQGRGKCLGLVLDAHLDRITLHV
jgi:hypothetical protein